MSMNEDLNRLKKEMFLKKCLEAGMNAHLSKPMDVEKLCGLIEGLRKRK